jgi:hypothetical protein
VVASGPVPMHHALHHPAMHPPPNMHQHAHHLQQQQLSGLDGGPGGFDPHGMLTDHNQTSASHQQQQQLFADGSSAVQGPGGYGMIAPPPQQPMDSPGVMPPFDIQVGHFIGFLLVYCGCCKLNSLLALLLKRPSLFASTMI